MNVKNNYGINSILDALTGMGVGVNSNNLIYLIFEQELIKALNAYIKMGDGHATLYMFYKNFVEAIDKKNTIAQKLKASSAKIPLEDSHVLPSEIIINEDSIQKLKTYLVAHLPNKARRDLYKTVAKELLLIHNKQKVTAAQLRTITGLSVPGFAKHLPKLQRSSLIIKQPPLNYVLTTRSKHILLQTFGIKKQE